MNNDIREGLFVLHKTGLFVTNRGSFPILMVHSGKIAPRLKTHIYWQPGRALFNQEKTKLM